MSTLGQSGSKFNSWPSLTPEQAEEKKKKMSEGARNYNITHKRGITNGKNSALICEFIEQLMENVKCCRLAPSESNNSLSDTFNVGNISEWNAEGISFGTLCFTPRTQEISDISLRERFYSWFKYVIQYIPEKYRSIKMMSNTTSPTSPMFRALKEWNEWFLARRSEIEVQLAEKYFYGGKMNTLEILKRRYRLGWSEAKVIDLTADTKVAAKVEEDMSINIVFKDAQPKENKDAN